MRSRQFAMLWHLVGILALAMGLPAHSSLASGSAAPKVRLSEVILPSVIWQGIPFKVGGTWHIPDGAIDDSWQVTYQLRGNAGEVIAECVSETRLGDVVQTETRVLIDECVVTSSVSAGLYSLTLFVHADGVLLPLETAGEQSDGSVLIGEVSVRAAQMGGTRLYLPLAQSPDGRAVARGISPSIQSVTGVSNGSVLRGRVYIGATTYGDVSSVEFNLTGPTSIDWTEAGSPWWFLGNNGSDKNGWDTTSTPDGSYKMVITASGGSGSVRVERAFSVDNVQSTTAFRNGVFITPARLTAIRKAVADRRSPNYSAYSRLVSDCDSARYEAPTPPSTLSVPNFYENPDGHARAKEAIKNDSNNAYALALCYRITGKAAYGEASARIIKAWGSTLKYIDTSQNAALVFSYHFPSMIFAADLLRDSPVFSGDASSSFSSFLKSVALRGSTMDANSRVGCGYRSGETITNNWSDWGVLLEMSIAVYTRNTTHYNETTEKWRSNVRIQIDDNGNLPIEGRRNDCSGDTGLHYTNFAMLPLTIAAEIADNNGTNLYDDWRFVRAVRRTAEVDRYPSRFPFFSYSDSYYPNMRYKVAWLELTSNHVSDSNASWLLSQFRPTSLSEVLRFATLTHGNLPVN